MYDLVRIVDNCASLELIGTELMLYLDGAFVLIMLSDVEAAALRVRLAPEIV